MTGKQRKAIAWAVDEAKTAAQMARGAMRTRMIERSVVLRELLDIVHDEEDTLPPQVAFERIDIEARRKDKPGYAKCWEITQIVSDAMAPYRKLEALYERARKRPNP